MISVCTFWSHCVRQAFAPCVALLFEINQYCVNHFPKIYIPSIFGIAVSKNAILFDMQTFLGLCIFCWLDLILICFLQVGKRKKINDMLNYHEGFNLNQAISVQLSSLMQEKKILLVIFVVNLHNF